MQVSTIFSKPIVWDIAILLNLLVLKAILCLKYNIVKYGIDTMRNF